jgi:hypothetical protein
MIIKKFWNLHKFFVETSRPYVQTKDKKTGKFGYTMKDRIYYPVAYVKFMWYSYTK